jgi:hypothetical protein
MHLRENRDCYQNPEQREILLQLLETESISGQFFLTGGTALSVFYLHHRLSNDLDLFSRIPTSLKGIDSFVRTKWAGEAVKIKESRMFISYVIRGTKVDFVVDPLSLDEHRPVAHDQDWRMIRPPDAR